jgi:hypothetical protein
MLPEVHKPTLHQLAFSNLHNVSGWSGQALYLYAWQSIGDDYQIIVNAAYTIANARAGTSLVAQGGVSGGPAPTGTLSFYQLNSSGISFDLDYSGLDLSALGQKHEAVLMPSGVITQQTVSNLVMTGGRDRTFHVKPVSSDNIAMGASTVSAVNNYADFELNRVAYGDIYTDINNSEWTLQGEDLTISFFLSGFLEGADFAKFFSISSHEGDLLVDNIDEAVAAANETALAGRTCNAVKLNGKSGGTEWYYTAPGFASTSTVLYAPDVVTINLASATSTQTLHVDPSVLLPGKRFIVKVLNPDSTVLDISTDGPVFRGSYNYSSTLTLPLSLEENKVVYAVELVCNLVNGVYYLDIVGMAMEEQHS